MPDTVLGFSLYVHHGALPDELRLEGPELLVVGIANVFGDLDLDVLNGIVRVLTALLVMPIGFLRQPHPPCGSFGGVV